MSISDETLRLDTQLRIRIDRNVDHTIRLLVQRWAEAWSTVAGDWNDVVAMIIEARDDGTPLKVAQALRARKTLLALEATRDALAELATYAGITITEPLADLSVDAAAAQLDIMRSQLPLGPADTLGLRASVIRADPAQIAAIVRRVTETVTTLADDLGEHGMAAVRNELIRAVQLGLNPRETARRVVTANRLVNHLEHGFNIPLNRALIITRTEQIDAARDAATVAQHANADVLQGWQWLAQLDTRTCPSCWAQHGSIHPLEEPGPWDHQQGRCTRMPVVRPWSELGYDIPEPPSLIPDAAETFDQLTDAEQLAIMGQRRLDLFRDGTIGWDDMSAVRQTSGWRDSLGVRPLRDIPAATRQAG